jgi:hypothetical protein
MLLRYNNYMDRPQWFTSVVRQNALCLEFYLFLHDPGLRNHNIDLS